VRGEGLEEATGGGARRPREEGVKLLMRADMSGVSSNFVKKFVWVVKVVSGLSLLL
jgi:hypothetical protein